MRFSLPNGLTVVLQENHAARVVAFQLWVKVGSADETDVESGLAHLHEHMLFKGTARRGPGEIARDVEASGGDINAWTSFDQTVYHLVLASQYFDAGLDILADAATASTFDAGELSREIEVVLEEIKRSYDLPSRKVSKEVFALAYESHPYRRPVIGTPQTVQSFDRPTVLDFYRRYYAPRNCVLLAVGDFDEVQARAKVEKAFGGWSNEGIVPRPRVIEPPLRAPRAKVMREEVAESYLSIAWRAPGMKDEDVPLLDLLAVLLGQGDSSRLALRVKREKSLVNEVYAYAYTPKDPGLIIAGATLPPEKVLEATREILTQTYLLRSERVGAGALETAKQIVESDAIYQRETVQGQARKLGFFETVAGSADFEELYYQRIAAATEDDLMAVARKYLTSSGVTVVAMLPTGGPALGEDALLGAAREAEDAERARPVPSFTEPPAAARAAFSTAFVMRKRGADRPVERFVLANGAVLLVKEEHDVPLVAMRSVAAGGLRYESEADNGIHNLLARVITRGTTKRGAEEIARSIDEMAGHISGNSGRNSFGLRSEFVSRHFERGFRLIAECLTEPAFAESEVAKERQLQVQEIKSRDDNPSGAVFELFSRTLYTKHPYRLDVLGREEVVSRLGSVALRELYTRHYPPSTLVVSVVGDVDAHRTHELGEELLGGNAARAAAAPAVQLEPPVDRPREAKKHVPKAQAHMVLGYLGARVKDADRFPLELLSAVLAGQGGRLFIELRDKRSMAYSITSFSVEGLDPGYFAVYMGTSPEKVQAALAGIRDELDKVRTEKVSEDELRRAQRHLVGTHEIGLQKNASRAATIAFDEAYGMGAGDYLRYAERIEAVTREQILTVAQKYIVPERSVLAMVTPG